MATISAALVKDLREKTGAGMMDCKTALGETGGDIEAAIDWLRKKGLAKAAKKSGRVAAEGLVDLGNKFAGAVPGAKFKCPVRFNAGAVGDVRLQDAALRQARQRSVSLFQQLRAPSQ